MRLAFGRSKMRLRANSLEEVRKLLVEVERLAHVGYWCVGHLKFEAATAFDSAFRTHTYHGGSLAEFAVYREPLAGTEAAQAWEAPRLSAARVSWMGHPDRKWFDRSISKILEAIASGEAYQVNCTGPSFARFQGDPLALFHALRAAQPDSYAAWLAPGSQSEDAIMSVSPELFFHWDGNSVTARPMKGTAPRGADAEADARRRDELLASEKERAENLMIVDLVRNDLSRIAKPFGVSVSRLFYTEAWPTVWQMSSEIVATPRPNVSLLDLFGALFPCGSVTGTPKARAMQIIHSLERRARGVYCGAIGVVKPGGAATFNVPIRTLALTPGHTDWTLRYDVGSGITADSTLEGEWAEWGHKALFVERAISSMKSWRGRREDQRLDAA